MITATKEPGVEFSLLGGPLYRLGRQLGLIRDDNNSVALGLSIGLLLWAVLVVLALIGGAGDSLFSLRLIGAHVRLLVVIPMMFVSETILNPRMSAFAHGLVRRGIVQSDQRTRFDSLIGGISRWRDSWLLEALCLLVALLMAFGVRWLETSGNSADISPDRIVGGGAWAAWWYWAICLTVFRFLLARTVLRVILWAYFLWRVSRLNLRLYAMHPDCTAGLGNLVTVQMQFIPLVLGFAILRSAQFAEEISSGTMTLEAIYPGIAVLMLLNLVLVIGPVLVFSPKLWKCRLDGLADYMVLAEDYVGQFDRKWVRTTPRTEPILGTPDIQSLSDISNSVQNVLKMRLVPTNMRALTYIIGSVALPMLPLALFKFPITDLAKKLVTGLIGL
jgi:hypothetical protein